MPLHGVEQPISKNVQHKLINGPTKIPMTPSQPLCGRQLECHRRGRTGGLSPHEQLVRTETGTLTGAKEKAKKDSQKVLVPEKEGGISRTPKRRIAPSPSMLYGIRAAECTVTPQGAGHSRRTLSSASNR